MSFYQWFRGTLRLYFSLFFKLKIQGLENFPEGAAILAPNHVSYFDPLVLSGAIKEDLHFLAKDSLFHNRFLHFFLTRLHTHPVKRGEQNIESFKMLSGLLKKGYKVVIFPEGVRSYSDELQPLQQGVAALSLRNHAPIVPVYIRGSFKAWPRTKKFPHLFGRLSVTIGKPIYPESYAHLSKKEAAAALTESLFQALTHYSSLN